MKVQCQTVKSLEIFLRMGAAVIISVFFLGKYLSTMEEIFVQNNNIFIRSALYFVCSTCSNVCTVSTVVVTHKGVSPQFVYALYC
jgi:hypothetical protein